MAGSIKELLFPVGGLNKRLDYQQQPPFTSPDMSNVWPDDSSQERERGGSRWGTAKQFSEQLGSGNPIRLIDSLAYVSSGSLKHRVIAVSNGILSREEPAGTLATVTTDLTLANDRVLQGGEYVGEYVIADNAADLAAASDGVIGGAGSNELTSTAAGNFASAGVNDDDHVVVITSHNAIDAVQTVTINGSPTGGTFTLRFGLTEDSEETTSSLAYNAAASAVEDALEVLGGIGAGNVTVSGSAGGPYTITFAGDLADQPIPAITADDSFLTGGTNPSIAVAQTTIGATATQYAGVYTIASVVTTTITLDETLRALTGVVFRVARGPKVFDGAAATLSLLMTEDDDDGNPKGHIPVGRTLCAISGGRLWLAGGVVSPHSFEVSRQGNIRDFDFSRDDAGTALAGTLSDAASLGQPITALVPHGDECVIIGTATTLWVFRGNPTAGGRRPNLSYEIGIVDKNAWCHTPEGALFFLSADGVYVITAPCGGTPQSVSRERLPKELLNVDTSSYTVSMAYDVRMRGIHLWVTKNSQSAASEHWLIDYKLSLHNDAPTAAFFPITLGSHNFEPFTAKSRHGTGAHSQVMLGCRDGYVRRFSPDDATDDGTAFNSYCYLGPVRLGKSTHDQAILSELWASIPASSGDVDCAVRVGKSAELAYTNSAFATVEWNTPGRQASSYIRAAGHAATLRLSNGESGVAWRFSSAGITILPAGRVRP